MYGFCNWIIHNFLHKYYLYCWNIADTSWLSSLIHYLPRDVDWHYNTLPHSVTHLLKTMQWNFLQWAKPPVDAKTRDCTLLWCNIHDITTLQFGSFVKYTVQSLKFPFEKNWALLHAYKTHVQNCKIIIVPFPNMKIYLGPTWRVA